MASALFQSRGYSVIELLVAVALCAMLLGGVVAIFVGSRHWFSSSDAVSRMQESGHHALNEILGGVRSAGFSGCARSPRFVFSTLNDSDAVHWAFLQSAVTGYQGKGAGSAAAIEGAGLTNADPGSDILLIRRPVPGSTPARLRTPMSDAAEPLYIVAEGNALKSGQLAMIYNCEAAAYFHADRVEDDVVFHAASTAIPGNSTNSMGYAFGASAEIIPVETILYYVGTKPVLGGVVRSLWKHTGSGTPLEVSPDIENMQLRFGVDANEDSIIDEYVSADDVDDWQTVRSVNVTLAVREPDASRPSARHPPVSSEPVFRIVPSTFSATAAIRSRTSKPEDVQQ
jgi:type IV pilus assembly protein PilW